MVDKANIIKMNYPISAVVEWVNKWVAASIADAQPAEAAMLKDVQTMVCIAQNVMRQVPVDGKKAPKK